MLFCRLALWFGAALLIGGCVHPSRRPAAPGPQRARSELKQIHFTSRVAWVPYQQALAEAKRTGKPICLVLYASDCKLCRGLAKLLDHDEIVKVSGRLVMVLQDNDARTPWLPRYDRYGSYVPRILFLDGSGKVREQLRSGNRTYPYFYSGFDRAELKRSMLSALAR